MRHLIITIFNYLYYCNKAEKEVNLLHLYNYNEAEKEAKSIHHRCIKHYKEL